VIGDFPWDLVKMGVVVVNTEINIYVKYVKIIMHLFICFVMLYALVKVDWGSIGFRIFGNEIPIREPLRSIIYPIINFIGSDNSVRDLANFSLILTPLVLSLLLSSYAVITLCIAKTIGISYVYYSLVLCVFFIGVTAYRIWLRMNNPLNTFWYDFSIRVAICGFRLVVIWFVGVVIHNVYHNIKSKMS